jgi:hypothetical protein
MTDFEDFDLDNPGAIRVPPPEPPSRLPWVLGAVALVALAGAVTYFALRQGPQTGPDTAAVLPSAAEPAPPPIAGTAPAETIALPPLGETDPLVRQLVGQLSGHPTVAAWLATDQLIRNFAVVTLNVADGRTPAQLLETLEPDAEFVVAESDGTLYIDPRSYRRYDPYAAAVASLDARGTARLYATLKPRVQDAARELGYAQGDFDRVIEDAIVELLGTPVVEGDVELREKTISYALADPSLEALSSAQRQLLRMGPRNVRTIQAKLREIARELAIPPERLPRPASR